ncbi:MAG: glucosaminidase domain-containing protein [Treponema sp.]|nr:glucosaminidase domain-containing protein [Treponema sp.]
MFGTKKIIPSALLATTLLFLLFSCASVQSKIECSRTIADKGVKSASELAAFFMSQNPGADKAKVHRLAKYYVQEASAEGINSDIAWVQMCHETGFLRFGGLVTEDMNNFCGLGAINAENRGERFETEQLGVRAHIQHLHAYGTTADKKLKHELVDRRYRYVQPRGKAPTVFELSGTWAGNVGYGNSLDSLLLRLEK